MLVLLSVACALPLKELSRSPKKFLPPPITGVGGMRSAFVLVGGLALLFGLPNMFKEAVF